MKEIIRKIFWKNDFCESLEVIKDKKLEKRNDNWFDNAHEDVKNMVKNIVASNDNSLSFSFYLNKRISTEKEKYEFLENEFKNNLVIELWPWWEHICDFINSKDYKWVDISYENKDYNIVKQDAVSYLKWLKDNSWIIVSVWMIDDSLYNWDYNEYLNILKEEIIRVSNWKALLVWWWFWEMKKYFWKPKIPFLLNVWWYYEFDKN